MVVGTRERIKKLSTQGVTVVQAPETQTAELRNVQVNGKEVLLTIKYGKCRPFFFLHYYFIKFPIPRLPKRL